MVIRFVKDFGDIVKISIKITENYPEIIAND